MHITFNLLSKLESSIKFDGFYGYEGPDGCESTRLFYREILEVTLDQYGSSVWRVEFKDHFPNLEVLLNALWNLLHPIWIWTT
jgi:hypothetical protein